MDVLIRIDETISWDTYKLRPLRPCCSSHRSPPLQNSGKNKQVGGNGRRCSRLSSDGILSKSLLNHIQIHARNSIVQLPLFAKLDPDTPSETYADDDFCEVPESSASNYTGNLDDLDEDDIEIEIAKTGKNRRRITSKTCVEADLQTVWDILTDYERLADFIPGLAVSQLLEKGDNFARLFQIGQQSLAFGLKFNAKGVVDCYEKDVQVLPFGRRRDIEFKMIEGDFKLFEGKWSVEEVKYNAGKEGLCDSAKGKEFQTTLFYVVEVEPKLLLPVRLVQGRLCSEIKINLSCIRNEAQKTFNSLQWE